MSEIKRIKIRVGKSDEVSLLHDSRKDVRILSMAINHLIAKVNELVDEVNALKGGNEA